MLDKVLDVKILHVEDDDLIILRVDVGSLPMHMAEKYMNQVRDVARVYFLTQRIWVLPTKSDLMIVRKGQVLYGADDYEPDF
jgi:hypothetical protein